MFKMGLRCVKTSWQWYDPPQRGITEDETSILGTCSCLIIIVIQHGSTTKHVRININSTSIKNQELNH